MLGKGTLLALSSMPFGLAKFSASVLSIQGLGCEVYPCHSQDPRQAAVPTCQAVPLHGHNCSWGASALPGLGIVLRCYALPRPAAPEWSALRGQARSRQG